MEKCSHIMKYVGIQDGKIYYKCQKCGEVRTVPQKKND